MSKSKEFQFLDQNNFKCYSLPDGSTYYGQVKQSIAKIIKEGQGIYISHDKKYIAAGKWSNDQLNGEAYIKAPDGSKYKGSFKNGKREGFGKYDWPNSCTYSGNWKEGFMEGEGTFMDSNGRSLKGTFARDYYITPSKIAVQPFLDDSLKEKYIQCCSKFKALEKKRIKYEKVKLTLTSKTTDEAIEEAKSIGEKGRCCIFASSNELNYTLANIKQLLLEKLGKEVYLIDIRAMSNSITSKSLPAQISLINEEKTKINDAISKGHTILISLDDSDAVYEHLFETKLEKYQRIIAPEIIQLKGKKKMDIGDGEEEIPYKINYKNAYLWTKIKPSECDSAVFASNIEKRFGTDLTEMCIGIILNKVPEKPKEPEAKKEEEVKLPDKKEEKKKK